LEQLSLMRVYIRTWKKSLDYLNLVSEWVYIFWLMPCEPVSTRGNDPNMEWKSMINGFSALIPSSKLINFWQMLDGMGRE
jgi:hypothetical protein